MLGVGVALLVAHLDLWRQALRPAYQSLLAQVVIQSPEADWRAVVPHLAPFLRHPEHLHLQGLQTVAVEVLWWMEW